MSEEDIESLKSYYEKAKEVIKDQHNEIERLNNRIDKAIEYIENNVTYSRTYVMDPDKLLDILKGCDKE